MKYFNIFANRIEPYSNLILRIGLFSIFIYFGVSGILNPAQQYEAWVSPFFRQFLPVQFISVFAAAEIVIALMFLLGYKTRIACVIAGVFLLGIIANLGFNDIAIRDFVILTAIILLFAKGAGKYSFDKKN